MTPRPLCKFWVASCVPDGGAIRYCLYADGTAARIGKIPMPEPMWLEIEGERMWAVLRAPFRDTEESGVAAYDLRTGDRLTDVRSTKGVVACHLAVRENDLYAANYVSGSVWRAPDVCREHTGRGSDPERQRSPHPHSVVLSPDGEYLLVCDLGLDTVFVYDRALNEVSRAATPAGAGPRHLTFSRDGRFVYVISEMGAALHSFAWENGTLRAIGSVSVLPDGFSGAGKGAAVRLSENGKRLYVTERGSETVSVFAVDGPRLTRLQTVYSHGAEPRDLALLPNGSFAICANQFSDVCSIWRTDPDGSLHFFTSIGVPRPVCALSDPGDGNGRNGTT